MDNSIYASFWIRLSAMIIDVLIIIIPISIVLTTVYGATYSLEQKSVGNIWSTLLNNTVPAILTIFFWRKFLGTPGKMLLKVKVVDKKTGGPLTLLQCIIRYMSYTLSAIPLMLGFIWIAIDKEGQSFHDKISGTVVVRDLDAYITLLNN